jgi:hypothetical protein
MTPARRVLELSLLAGGGVFLLVSLFWPTACVEQPDTSMNAQFDGAGDPVWFLAGGTTLLAVIAALGAGPRRLRLVALGTIVALVVGLVVGFGRVATSCPLIGF